MSKITPIKGVLAYVYIPRAVANYNEDGFEWKATVIATDKEVVKTFKKEVKDSGFAIKTEFKELDLEDALAKYKLESIPGAGDEVWAITVKRSTKYGKGENSKDVPEIYRPKTLLVGEDGDLENITPDVDENGSIVQGTGKLVANGSTGYVSVILSPRANSKTEANLYLQNVLVEELIEYTPTAAEPGSEFDSVIKGKKTKTESAEKTPEKVEKTPAKTKQKSASPFDEE